MSKAEMVYNILINNITDELIESLLELSDNYYTSDRDERREGIIAVLETMPRAIINDLIDNILD